MKTEEQTRVNLAELMKGVPKQLSINGDTLISEIRKENRKKNESSAGYRKKTTNPKKIRQMFRRKLRGT